MGNKEGLRRKTVHNHGKVYNPKFGDIDLSKPPPDENTIQSMLDEVRGKPRFDKKGHTIKYHG